MKPWEQYQAPASAGPWAKYGGGSAPEAPPDPTGSFGENVVAGIGRAMVRSGRAVKEAIDVPAQALERTFGGQGVSRALGMPTAAESAATTQANLAEAERLDAPLMATTGGKVGDVIGNVAMFAPTIAIPGANTATGAGLIGAVGSALTTPGDLAERGKAGALGAVGGAGGQIVGRKIAQAAAGRIAAKPIEAANRAQQNAVRDTTLKAATDAGYVVPPSTTNPTVKNRLLESISGKAQTQQMASVKNQQVTNQLARQSLGLADNTPITLDALQGIRSKAGEVYAEVAGSGRVIADPKYAKDLLDLSKKADRLNIDFPDLKVGAKDEIVNLTNSLTRREFDAESAVELVKTLRADGAGNLSPLVRAANPEKFALGKAQLKAAEVVENQLMRALTAKGRPDLGDAFDQARTQIAKTYSVQNALNESTGNVVAGNLAKQMKKGKYLSDGLDTAAKFAQSFPKAAAEIKDSAGVSALDAFTGLGLGMVTGNPLAVAAPAVARMGTRSAILSGPGQRLLAQPRYEPSNSLALILAEQAGRFGAPLGAGGVR